MNKPSEMERLATAVAAMAATISEIIGENLRRATTGMATDLEGKIGAKTLETVLTTEQMAEHLKITRRTLENWMRRGYVPYYKIGRTVRFKLSDVQRVWDNNYRIARRHWR